MLKPLVAPTQRLKALTKQAIAGIVSTAGNAHYGRWYYSNRWHPHHALLEDALAETVDYIKSNMSSALILRDEIGVISHALRAADIDGLVMEFGVRSGRTINHIARRRPKTTVHGFDSFEGLPEAWAGYTMDAGAFGGEGIPEVRSNVRLHVGWFDATLPEFLVDHDGEHEQAVAFIHIDSDIYSSAKTILEELAPRFRSGSVIVFNEYFNYPNWKEHEFRAWQEFCADHDVTYEYLAWGMYEASVMIRSIGEGPTS
ncbi:MAG: class I SAM-dependent methyltransferase [Ilumatobacter sp.]|uniref:class I SAM-dependent methyltransferase n=1 Tax=Ilumatobacter sp. TaxID=1967498 RepID=UPI003C722AC2